MTVRTLETDYLVIGAGAMGMAFADEILSQSATDRVLLVDKHARPGGHWNDAYSFVSLHQPAAYYGVNSEKLGSGGSALASGIEVLAYYERVMKKLLGTGRLQYFPMCESDGAGRFVSLMEGDAEYAVTVRKKTVDASYMKVEVPSMREPPYPVAPDISIVPPNGLADVRRPGSGYVIVGAGKTGMDAVLFLLDRGVDPDHITWIMSNDSWLFDRAQIQPRRALEDGIGSQMKNIAESDSLEAVFHSLEADKRILRIDPNVWPTKYRCATVSLDELEQLRRVERVVRMGRVERIESDTIVLEKGTLATDAGRLHVDCSANGLASREIRPVFAGEHITLQSLFMCQQVFSAAVIGYVESAFSDDERKNQLCQVVPHPEFSRDYLVALNVSLTNMENWTRNFGRWVRGSRLCFAHHESAWALLRNAQKTRKIIPHALEKMRRIIEQEFPGGVAG